MNSDHKRRLARFRIQIFASTWLSYVGFYFCRHAFYVLKPVLGTELDIGASELGDVEMVYLVAYTAGQFISAGVGHRTGARLLLLTGMGLLMFFFWRQPSLEKSTTE